MDKKLRSPIFWFGGKGRMVQNILPLIPNHKIYIEPFGGSAALLFAKEPSPVEVYNDLDSGLVNFFRVLRDPIKFEKFYKQVQLIPYSREEYYNCCNTWEQETDDVMRAVKWYVVARQSFSGKFGSGWHFTITATSRNMSASVSGWLSAIDMLPEICNRLLRVQVEHKDAKDVIKTYDTPETLFYCDPPYVPSTRRSGGYRHEMTEQDHEELVNLLLNIKGMAILSGYPNHIYERLEQAGWTRFSFTVTCSAVGRTKNSGLQGTGMVKEKQQRTECVWLSPNCKTISSEQLSLLGEDEDG